ncbi:MAG TPA: TraR/DksA C4-type zinc finger protein [Tepidisphaeraceae bacterium]|jgi:hypothetical protein|nr:TraR/DksA C4-type zinc finger protein [Tepidisphaeraceae bacterium]
MAKPRPCQRCGNEIPAERLEVMPETRLCIACSKAVGGEFDIAITAENLAKAGSLKKNYGSFDVQKTRREIRKKERE